jgi:hypothetical protein
MRWSGLRPKSPRYCREAQRGEMKTRVQNDIINLAIDSKSSWRPV